MKMKGLVVISLAVVLLAGCGAGLDVVAREAVSSFEQASAAVSQQTVTGGWQIEFPGSERFIIAADFSRGTADFVLDVEALPFIVAGLDQERMPKDRMSINLDTGRLQIRFDAGETRFSAVNLQQAFAAIAANYRNLIGYHSQLDHFGLTLGNGCAVEWAKNIGTNDKDWVLVLDPAWLASYGLRPERLNGWLYAPVKVKNDQGVEVEVMKLLKAWNLR